MTMVSMKTESEVEEYTPSPYGYGLCIQLTEEQVEALGLSDNPPKPGSSVGIRAIAIVQRVSQEAETDEGETNKMDTVISFQITDLEINPSGAVSQSANLLYGGA